MLSLGRSRCHLAIGRGLRVSAIAPRIYAPTLSSQCAKFSNSVRHLTDAKTTIPSGIQSDTTLPTHVPESDVTAANAPTKALFSLKGRTVVITGGARGLGITLATAVLEAGGDVVCLDILPEPSADEWVAIQNITKKTGLYATYKHCDVTNEEMVEELLSQAAEEAQSRGNPIRGLVHCAGIQLMEDALEYPIDGLKRILDVNVTGSFILAKHTARVMKKTEQTGSLVLVASMSGQIANRGLHCSGYNTSKGAVQQMGRSFAAEFGKFGVRVNTLSPGYIRTAMTDQLLAVRPDLEKFWLAGAMLGRLGAPEDFKAPTVFLLADGSSWMTGADLRVDGGHCASA